jgi:hypothetical protein
MKMALQQLDHRFDDEKKLTRRKAISPTLDQSSLDPSKKSYDSSFMAQKKYAEPENAFEKYSVSVKV